MQERNTGTNPKHVLKCVIPGRAEAANPGPFRLRARPEYRIGAGAPSGM